MSRSTLFRTAHRRAPDPQRSAAPLPSPLLVRDRTLEVVAMRPGDTDVVRAVFDGMGERSRTHRFLVPVPRLTPGLEAALSSVDGDRHVALVARAVGDGHRPVGTGRYIRTDARSAELALEVVDDWQGRGVGTRLLHLLADHARRRGLEAFHGTVLAENRPMLVLLAREFADVRLAGDRGVVDFAAPLAPRLEPARGLR